MEFVNTEELSLETLQHIIKDLRKTNIELKKEHLKLKVKLETMESDMIEKTLIGEKPKSSLQVQITHWMEQNCIEADNVETKDGKLYAPTHYETLYDNYVEWCEEEESFGERITVTDKKTFKNELLKWQENSKYGLSIAKSKKDSEGYVNGYRWRPLINLRII